MEKSIIIAGAGLAGLTLGVALARKKWRVTIFERAAQLREIGAGLYIWENGLKVIDEIGLGDKLYEKVEFIKALNMVDKDYGQMHSTSFSATNRFCVIPRQDVYQALLQAAQQYNIEIITSAEVARVDEGGQVILKNGENYSADLIVGADGVHSNVRESLNIGKKEIIGNGAWRALIPRIEEDLTGIAEEHWNDYRRIGIAPSTDQYRYVYLTGRSDDTEALTEPFNKESWITSFPHLKSVIDRIEYCRLDRNFCYVYLEQWYKGKVAIIGDAAHGMEPNLGQGAGVSITSALELAKQLEMHEIDEALSSWEKIMKPVAEKTQIWSRIYGAAAGNWPPELLHIRADIVSKCMGSENIDLMISTAARHVTGNQLIQKL